MYVDRDPHLANHPETAREYLDLVVGDPSSRQYLSHQPRRPIGARGDHSDPMRECPAANGVTRVQEADTWLEPKFTS